MVHMPQEITCSFILTTIVLISDKRHEIKGPILIKRFKLKESFISLCVH